MKLRTIACLIGALAISSAPFVLAVSGGGFPSQPHFLYVGVGRSPSSGVTEIVAANSDSGGTGDVEIVSQTFTSGNAQFRAVNNGGTNWAWGNLRSDNSFDICNASTLTGCAVTYSTGAFPQAIQTGAATTPGPWGTVTRNSTATGYTSSRLYNDQNIPARALEIDYSGSSYASALMTSGPTGESAGISTTGAFPMCIGTAGTCVLEIDGTKNVTAPGAASVPWAKPPCIIKATFSGTTPSVNSSSGCASPSVSRGSVGSYTFTDANITGLIGVCTPNSSSSGPYLQDLVSVGGGSALVNNFAVPGTASVLADIPSGASLTCRFDR